MRPSRYLAALAAIFVVLGALVWFGAPKGATVAERFQPKLGLDLVGGTRVTLEAATKDGNPPNRDDLEKAREIIEERVNAQGVSEAEVVTEGDRFIVISVAAQKSDVLRDVGQASKLYFRKVLNITDGSGAAANPAPAPSASTTPTSTPTASSTPSATPSGGTGGGSAMEPTPTPTPTATSSATAESDGRTLTQDELKKLVGDEAWAAATSLTAPATDAEVIKKLAPFGKLQAKWEIASLTPAMQYNIPQVTCELLNKRVPGSLDVRDQQVVACEGDGKYLLDVAKVAGTDVSNASALIDQSKVSGSWVVNLDFTGDGQTRWTDLTREAYNNNGTTKCETVALGEQQRCRVAAVLDNSIVSAPEIQGVLTGTSTISGSFTAGTAKKLADNLNFGALAINFEVPESKTVTATLGAEYLRAGLLAAGIGMLLVVIYSFFYYRLLGSVIFLSLILSGLLTFGALVVLGRTMGFTLTLAGIAGFIVSLGVAADSFVIYFERLKDEIREGRSPRNAVQRAWVRAKRTILTANAISLMAAVILYLVSSGPVAGFAFALGIATALDLLVVFLFRYPIMAMFARTQAFLSPRVSGLGRVLREAKEAN
ncbi:protein translocase subunit SecD [Catelliglobosispora koreensis]|uniref:protein translocase subunit SecD n=1 Tax=Catelliglobosispora koreensis TaxID=129052 RepID=UPI000369A44B